MQHQMHLQIFDTPDLTSALDNEIFLYELIDDMNKKYKYIKN